MTTKPNPRLLCLIDEVTDRIGKAISFLIWAGIAVLCFEVVARYLLNAPTIWAHGYTQRIFGAYFVLIGGYTLLKRSHIRIDIFLSSRTPRITAGLDFVNYMFALVLAVVLAWEGFWFFEDAWRYGDVDDSVLRHPMWPIKLCLFMGFVLLGIQALAEAIRAALRVVNPNIPDRGSVSS